MPGRKTKLTPPIHEAVCRAIRAGNYIHVAAAHAGIDKDTLYEWLKRGARATTGIHHAFREAVDKALAEGEVRDVALIAKASETQWQASAWRLERRFPDRWGRKDRVEHVGADGAALPAPTTQITVNILDDEELARRVNEILPQGIVSNNGANGNGHVLPSGPAQT